jgi:hypothetical protein
MKRFVPVLLTALSFACAPTPPQEGEREAPLNLMSVEQAIGWPESCDDSLPNCDDPEFWQRPAVTRRAAR